MSNSLSNTTSITYNEVDHPKLQPSLRSDLQPAKPNVSRAKTRGGCHENTMLQFAIVSASRLQLAHESCLCCSWLTQVMHHQVQGAVFALA